MVIELGIAFLAEAIISGLIRSGTGLILTELKNESKKNSAKKAFEKALGNAIIRYGKTARKIQLAKFLQKENGVFYDPHIKDEILKLLFFRDKPNVEAIGNCWKDFVDEKTPIQTNFSNETRELLEHIETELRNTDAFRPVFMEKSIDSLNTNAIISADELANINSRLVAMYNLQDTYLSKLVEMLEQTSDKVSTLIQDKSQFIADKIEDFVGREWIMSEIDQFVAKNTSGYFFIKGEPGIGKTVVASQLVNDRSYLHHFNIRSESNNTTRKFYQNVCAQMIGMYNLDHKSISENDTGDSNFLIKLFNEIVENHKEPIIIVIDALDEVDSKERKAAANVLNLPDILPKGLYIIATLRKDSDIHLPDNSASNEPKEREIFHDSPENMLDIEKYLQEKVILSGIQKFILAQKEIDPSFDEEMFVRILKEKSDGNFIYLRYVLNDIAMGKYKDKKYDSIPDGLAKYYERHWELMNEIDKKGMEEYKIPVIAALTVSPDPISINLISKFSKIKELHKIRKVLNEWGQFLHKEMFSENYRYRLYHASFYDFIYSREDVSDGRVDLGLARKNMIESFYTDE